MGNPLFMAQLANSNVLKRMGELGQHKAGSGDEQRGIDLFGEEDPAGYSTMTLNIILECLQHWAEVYPKDVNGKSTPFKELYNKMLSYNVVFPAQYAYIIKNVIKKTEQPNIRISQPSVMPDDATLRELDQKLRDQLSLIVDMIGYPEFDQTFIDEMFNEVLNIEAQINQIYAQIQHVDNPDTRKKLTDDYNFLQKNKDASRNIRDNRAREKFIQDFRELTEIRTNNKISQQSVGSQQISNKNAFSGVANSQFDDKFNFGAQQEEPKQNNNFESFQVKESNYMVSQMQESGFQYE